MFKIKFMLPQFRFIKPKYTGNTGLITIFFNWHGFRLVAKVYIPTLCKQKLGSNLEVDIKER